MEAEAWVGRSPTRRVRRVTHACIPRAARRDSEGGLWVNGLPEIERRKGQEHAVNVAILCCKTRAIWLNLNWFNPNSRMELVASHRDERCRAVLSYGRQMMATSAAWMTDNGTVRRG